MGKYNTTKKLKGFRRWFPILAVLLFLAVFGTGTLLARYVAKNEMQAEMIAAGFHISSDYLKEGGGEYSVSNWADGIQVKLYNYEVENVAQIAQRPISYEVKVPQNWNLTVEGKPYQAAGCILSGDGAQQAEHVLMLSYIGTGKPDSVTLEVTTTSPYVKTLTGTFKLVGSLLPNYTVADNGNHVLLTIHSNDYAGNVNINWGANLSPDNTNQYMVDWMDSGENSGGSHSLAIEPYHTYEMIFVGTGNSITVESGNSN